MTSILSSIDSIDAQFESLTAMSNKKQQKIDQLKNENAKLKANYELLNEKKQTEITSLKKQLETLFHDNKKNIDALNKEKKQFAENSKKFHIAQKKIIELEKNKQEHEAQQQGLYEQLIRAEAQVELIKSIWVRKKIDKK